MKPCQQNLNTKRFEQHLFILTWTQSMQIFGEICFVKPQNDFFCLDLILEH